MQFLGLKTIIATTAVAGLGTLAIAVGPAHAASSAAGSPAGASHVQTAGTASAAPTLTPAQLAALPLTNRDLTPQEISNLAVVLGAYHDAEGATLNTGAFIGSFTSDGVFNDVVAGKSYSGSSLGDVLTGMASLFPDVHRALKRITVSDNQISIELDIQGTFEGPLQTPAGTVKPNGAKVNVPTADFWYLTGGKIQTFNCYVGYSDMYAQMGVNLDWASAVAGS